MDARVKALMMLIAISFAPTQSLLGGIFSPPAIIEWKNNLAISERSGKYLSVVNTSIVPIWYKTQKA